MNFRDEDVIKVLESIGLSKNEVIIYLDLVRMGKSSAMDLSKRTRIHRSNIYDTLEKLIEKGIVLYITKENSKLFYPLNPKDLFGYIKQKEFDLKKIIPKIEEMHNKPYEDRKVTISEGLPAIRGILSKILELKKPIFEYGIPKNKPDILGGFLINFHKQRVKKKISIQLIYNMGTDKRIRELNKFDHTEARYLPSQYNSKVSTMICGNKTIFIFWEEPVSTIVVESESLADSYKNYFKLLWDDAKLTY